MTPLAALAVPLALAGDPCPIDVELAAVTPPWRDRSADLAALQTQRTWLGLSWRANGGRVRVTAVAAGGPAQRAGLAPGDRLLAIGGAPTTDTATTNAAFDAAGGGAPFTVSLERDGATLERTLGPGPADPLVLGLVSAASAQGCRSARLLTLDAAQTAAVVAGAFDDARGFRCADAHTRIGGLPSGSLVVVRGGSRVLLTAPGWGTTCVSVQSVDGPGLDPARLTALLDGVLAAYVQDRHDNP